MEKNNYHLTPIKMAIINKKKKKKVTRIGKAVEKLEPLGTAGGNTKWCNPYRKQYDGSSKNSNRITLRSSHPASEYLAQRSKSRNLERCLYSHVHGRIIHNNQGMEVTQASINRSMDRRHAVYTYARALVHLQKGNVVIPARARMRLDDITLSETSRPPQDKCCVKYFKLSNPQRQKIER